MPEEKEKIHERENDADRVKTRVMEQTMIVVLVVNKR